MRRVQLPIEESESINLIEIGVRHEKLLLVKDIEENIVGVIMYVEENEEWIFYKSLNTSDYVYYQPDLFSLVKEILKYHPTYQFFTT